MFVGPCFVMYEIVAFPCHIYSLAFLGLKHNNFKSQNYQISAKYWVKQLCKAVFFKIQVHKISIEGIE